MRAGNSGCGPYGRVLRMSRSPRPSGARRVRAAAALSLRASQHQCTAPEMGAGEVASPSGNVLYPGIVYGVAD